MPAPAVHDENQFPLCQASQVINSETCCVSRIGEDIQLTHSATIIFTHLVSKNGAQVYNSKFCSLHRVQLIQNKFLLTSPKLMQLPSKHSASTSRELHMHLSSPRNLTKNSQQTRSRKLNTTMIPNMRLHGTERDHKTQKRIHREKKQELNLED
jgi:hypothetical protein